MGFYRTSALFATLNLKYSVSIFILNYCQENLFIFITGRLKCLTLYIIYGHRREGLRTLINYHVRYSSIRIMIAVKQTDMHFEYYTCVNILMLMRSRVRRIGVKHEKILFFFNILYR